MMLIRPHARPRVASKYTKCKERNLKQDSIIIVDVANLAFRAVHTFKGITIKVNKNITINSGVIYKVFDTLFQLSYKYSPSAIFMIFEGNKQNNPRFTMCPEYKAKRPTSKTIDITSEILLIKQISLLAGFICITPQQGEADDGIANISTKFQDTHKVYILSNDHDMQILLTNNNITILKANNEINIRSSFLTKFGFRPELFSLFMAVTGDASDCLPGVKGIGEKKGIKLFQELRKNKTPITPKSISKHIVTQKLIKNTELKEIKKTIKYYWTITKIHPEWSINISKKKLDSNKLFSIFKELQMKQFINEKQSIVNNLQRLQNNKKTIIKQARNKDGDDTD